jgi:hypothetical protein
MKGQWKENINNPESSKRDNWNSRGTSTRAGMSKPVENLGLIIIDYRPSELYRECPALNKAIQILNIR